MNKFALFSSKHFHSHGQLQVISVGVQILQRLVCGVDENIHQLDDQHSRSLSVVQVELHQSQFVIFQSSHSSLNQSSFGV